MPSYTQLLKATDLVRHKSDGFTWYSGKINGIGISWEANCFWRGCSCYACDMWRENVGAPYFSLDLILDSEYVEPTRSYRDSCDGWRKWRDSRMQTESDRYEREWREMRGNY